MSQNLKIGIGIVFYQDFDSLNRLLFSLQSYPFDRIIAVDGRFKGHAGHPRLSDGKVRDLFRGYQTPYVIYDAPDITQIEKRQYYFDKAKGLNLDVIVVMDSDEYVIHNKTNWPRFVEELEQHIAFNKGTFVQGYSIPLVINQKRYPPDYTINSARVFYKPWELQYVDNHYTIRNKESGVNMGYQTDSTKLEHLTIGTDHKLREEKYMEQHDMYEHYQATVEETPEATRNRIDDFIGNVEKLKETTIQ